MTEIVRDILTPGLQRLGLYSPTDPTYGRYLIPPWAPEQALDNDPNIITTRRRIFLPLLAPADSVEVEYSEEIDLTPEELFPQRQRTGRWIYYKTWEMKPEALEGKEAGGKGVDMVIVHGLNEYGARYAPHCRTFLEVGFRIIVPDMPSYGRSTGIHAHIYDPHLLTSAVYAVLQDVVRIDVANGKKQREVFLSGASMGGWTVLYYLITYPSTSDVEKIVTSPSDEAQEGKAKTAQEYRPKIAGAFVMCPLVNVAPASRPNFLVEGIARVIVKFAGSLPMAEAVRGNVSDDPRVEEEFRQDPLTYKGKLRASTGLSLLHGLNQLASRAEEITLPIRIVHGDHDRATSHLATMAFFDRIASHEKSLEIYADYEHVMCKVGIDEEDDRKRQAVLADWKSWLLKRVEIDRKAGYNPEAQ
ncbi:hypothetical protein NliqN6_4127 [Naganishia liquefaciens]|uniref:Serine aminopeptidase S33 domain-containing protein n=1 Tax=Naganishia liquefaciens TaxID=104408 RepID=A0A8H3TUZ2_9TREE|nr:hypothetical protein NliqN6_4127 [Naganishia liquefaciens]